MDNPARAAHTFIMAFDSDILIVGGGLNGCAMALALGQSGFSVTLIDALPKATRRLPGFDGRSYAMALASTRLLDALGLWDGLRENAEPMLEIKVTDGRAGEGPSPFWMHFDHAEIGEGPMGYLVEDRHLRIILLDAVNAAPNVTHRAKESVTAQAVDDFGATITLGDATTLRGRLLIGCDGRGSGTAQRAGIIRNGWDYAQSSLVCAVAHEKPHHGIAHQFFMPQGPLAILPLTKNRSGVVWTETTERAQAINALSDAEYLDILRPRFGDFLGDIKLAGARYSYPLSLSIATSFIAPRTALVGDAAHGVHPIAGQGLNAGIKDIAALAEVLTEAARRGEDFATPLVLQRYQQWRRFDAATLAAATDGFNRLFSNDNITIRAIRDLGMGAVNALPALRKSFIREAAGLSGELPKLLKGQLL